MRTIFRSVIVCLSFSLFACGGAAHDRSKDIKSSPPSGHFNNTAWSMLKASISNDGTNLSVHLFGDNVPDCSTSPQSGSTTGYIIFTMPAKTGTRDLQLSLSNFSDPNNQTVTFVTPPSSNDISVDGILTVTNLTSTSVTLGILANGSSGDDVNGTVTTNLCP